MKSFTRARLLGLARAAACAGIVALAACSNNGANGSGLSPALIAKGKDIFRFETCGDETFWTDTLRMHEVIEHAVDPTTALTVGLKVDTTRFLPTSYPESRAARSVSRIPPRPSRSTG